MENSKEEWTEKVSVTTIVDDLERYRHGKRVLAKLQKDKEWFAKVGMPVSFKVVNNGSNGHFFSPFFF